MNVSVYEYDIKWMDYQSNVNSIDSHLESFDMGIDLLILPEMFLTGFNMDAEASAISESDSYLDQLAQLCQKYNTAMMGSLAIDDGGEYYNRALLITQNGVAGRYDKKRLFTPSGEDKAFSSKYPTKLFDYKGWKILAQVCYDLRFPENIRSIESPHLLVYMANWPAPRINHWNILLQARAIENQCWVIGCNRLGIDDNGWEFPGSSRIIKPNGSILIDGSSEIKHGTLSKEEVEVYRKKYPFQDDKGPRD